MHKGLKSIARNVYLSYEAFTNRRFYELRSQTNGMLLPIVYKKIYELCYQLPDLDIVEIGGATGAGSISIAWAMNDAQKKSQLIVVEKCEGGTRTDIGGYAENLELIQDHFQNFGARDRITLFPHEVTFENGEEVLKLIKTPQIAAFMHDADGRVDRDFYLFWNRLQPGGLIIVDDYANEAKYKPISDRHPTGGAKSIITYRLLNQMIQWGLFEPTTKIGKTIFGIKPIGADFSLFNLETCRRIVAGVEREREEFLKRQEQTLSFR